MVVMFSFFQNCDRQILTNNRWNHTKLYMNSTYCKKECWCNFCVHSSLGAAAMFFPQFCCMWISAPILQNYMKISLQDTYLKKHYSFSLCTCRFSLGDDDFFHNFQNTHIFTSICCHYTKFNANNSL